jgi:hypothetical protein
MEVVIKIEKKHLYFVVALICVLFVIGVNAYVNPGQTVGHAAEEVVAGTFGPGDYTFPQDVFFPANNRGIFWSSARNTAMPYIYANSGILRMASGGAKPIIAAGNLQVSGMTTANKFLVRNYHSCVWRTVPSNAMAWTCNANEFVAGIGYEGNQWQNVQDIHIYPEVNRLYCCRIGYIE